jgi:hypothetical protein
MVLRPYYRLFCEDVVVGAGEKYFEPRNLISGHFRGQPTTPVRQSSFDAGIGPRIWSRGSILHNSEITLRYMSIAHSFIL